MPITASIVTGFNADGNSEKLESFHLPLRVV
jgi:hypothetical protein